MNEKRIEKGDIVKVYFNNVPALHGATVEYVPQSAGEDWIFIENGKPVYVDNYSRMDLLFKYPHKTPTPIKDK